MPASAHTDSPPFSTAAITSCGSTLIGMPTMRQRHDRLAAHRVDVGQRIGRGDAAEVERVVDDRHEEVGGGDDRLLVVELVDGGVVGGVVADQQVGKERQRRAALEQIGEQAGRDLAAATAAVRQTGQTGRSACVAGGVGHCGGHFRLRMTAIMMVVRAMRRDRRSPKRSGQNAKHAVHSSAPARNAPHGRNALDAKVRQKRGKLTRYLLLPAPVP